MGLAHLPETRERLEQAIDLRFDLRTALFPLGEFERIFRCTSAKPKAWRRPSTINDILASSPSIMCHNLWMTGRPREALAFG